MSIKMRISKEKDARCTSCGVTRETSLELFDVLVETPQKNGLKFVLCDECVDSLQHKTLKACCMVSAKLKSSSDMRIINERKSKLVKPQQTEGHMSINEALKGIKDEDNLE